MADDSLKPKGSASDVEGAIHSPPNLCLKVDDIAVSVRARNVLRIAKLGRVADLVKLTEVELLELKQCGRATFDELRQKVAELGLHFGMRPDNGNRCRADESSSTVTVADGREATVKQLDPRSRATFYLRVDELNLSTRARNVLKAAQIEFVGDLVAKTETDLLDVSCCGRATISEIVQKLSLLGLRLGSAADWNTESAEAIREQLDSNCDSSLERLKRRISAIAPAEFLEDELRSIFASVANARDTDIALKQLGWSGKGKRTLESVGQEYSVTRERVRQVVATKVPRIRKMSVAAPRLEEALSAVRARCPATGAELAKELRRRGISKENFHPSGLQSACGVLQRVCGLRAFHVGSSKFYSTTEQANRPIEFLQLCRRLTSSQGCANFDAVCDELRIPEIERDSYREFATALSICNWLDGSRRWLFSTPIKRSRLSNLVTKVLSVSPTVNLSDLRKAVARSRRLGVAPPAGVLAEFVKRFGLATVSDNVATSTAEFRDAIKPGSSESILVAVLKAHGPILSWERFQRLSLASGMNPITFGIYVSGSPIVARVKRGIYSLVGAHIPPGVVEDLEREVAAARRPPEWGWSPRGTLWYALPITETILAAGSIGVPAVVANIVDGEWNSQFDGHRLDGAVKCSNGFLWGLRRPLMNAGGESGDVSVLEFDLSKRIVNMTLGGEELADMWENGNVDLPPPEMTDVTSDG